MKHQELSIFDIKTIWQKVDELPSYALPYLIKK
jgi:hypothetical protein